MIIVVEMKCRCGWSKATSQGNATQTLINATKARAYRCGFCRKDILARVWSP